MGDILGCHGKGGKPLLVCIATAFDKRFAHFPSEAAEQQSLMGIGGNVQIGGQHYHQLKVVVEHARSHDDLASGEMQKPEFYQKFDRKEGFTVRAIDTERGDAPGQPILITFLWQDLVYHAKEIMFFGSPLNTTRPFDPLFRRKNNPQFVFHVFKHMALEYWGDANASAQLYAAYLKRKSELLEIEVSKTGEAAIKSLYGSLRDMTVTQKVFCVMFDGLCQNEFVQCISSWNDYGKELVLQEDLERYIWAAENVAFPLQWQVIAGMRGLNEKHAREKGRLDWKRRQIFFQLL